MDQLQSSQLQWGPYFKNPLRQLNLSQRAYRAWQTLEQLSAVLLDILNAQQLVVALAMEHLQWNQLKFLKSLWYNHFTRIIIELLSVEPSRSFFIERSFKSCHCFGRMSDHN